MDPHFIPFLLSSLGQLQYESHASVSFLLFLQDHAVLQDHRRRHHLNTESSITPSSLAPETRPLTLLLPHPSSFLLSFNWTPPFSLLLSVLRKSCKRTGRAHRPSFTPAGNSSFNFQISSEILHELFQSKVCMGPSASPLLNSPSFMLTVIPLLREISVCFKLSLGALGITFETIAKIYCRIYFILPSKSRSLIGKLL